MMELYGLTTNGILLEFLHLGFAIGMFKPFAKTKYGNVAIKSPIFHTLSPNDPKFSSWWETYKSLIDKKKGGQEPVDD